MKKRILSILLMLTLVISLLPVSVFAATPEDSRFPDPIFCQYVYTNFDTDGDRYLDTDECAAVTSINVRFMEVGSLKGIEYFPKLEYLHCEYNTLASLDVTQNTVLKELVCNENALTSLDLSKNTALEYLYCSNNALTSLDLSKNTALEYLYCAENALTSLDLSKNTALILASCFGNKLTSIKVASTVLEFLECGKNALTSLDLSKSTALKELYCAENALTSLDLSKNTALEELKCTKNKLTSLKVTSTVLEVLRCDNNKLTSLKVTSTVLEVLRCDNNKLTSLNVPQSTVLIRLYCSNNALTALDVTKNTALLCLDCSNNALTSLDLSKNTVLAELYCQSNKLSYIDVSKTALHSATYIPSYFGMQANNKVITAYMTEAQKNCFINGGWVNDEHNVRVNVEIIVPGNPFVDVSAKSYCYAPVKWAVENGITSGVDSYHFEPNSPCTRGQIVTFLWRAAGKPEPTSTENPFTDVSAKKSYYKAVLWAVEQGITSGMTETTFEPNAPCTRGQAVTFLWRAAGKPVPTTTEHPFTDVSSKGFYYKAMLWAVEQGITKGETKTTFAPDLTCTRGQIVTFLYRAK